MCSERFTRDQPLSTRELWGLLGLDEDIYESQEPSASVTLTSFGDQKISVIKMVRKLAGIGLKDAKDFVESAPKTFERLLSFSSAFEWVMCLTSSGATAKINELPEPNYNAPLCLELAHHQDLSRSLINYLLASNIPEIQDALAKNPHLPREALSLVAQARPAAFLQNPILPLMLLEDPSLQQLNGGAILRLIEQEGALPMLYPAVLASDEAGTHVARFRLDTLPEEVLSALASSRLPGIRYALANNDGSPLWILERICAMVEDRALMDVAAHPNVSEDLLKQLSESSDEDIVASVARSKRVPLRLLLELAERNSSEVLHSVAQNPRTPHEILERILATGDSHLLDGLSCNTSLPRHIIERLLATNDSTIAQNMTRSELTSPEMLMSLFACGDENIRRDVLYRSKCPKELREKALQDPSPAVRAAATYTIKW
jgi:hypothetical protein